MKRFARIECIALIFLLGLVPGKASAAGIGFNLIGGGSEMEWEATNWSHRGSTKDFDFDTDLKSAGAGILFDSAVGRNKVFNYRFNLGWEQGDYKITEVYNAGIDHPGLSGTFETKGWFMSHDFGFKVYENNRMRVWLGPEIRLSKSEGDLNSNRNFEIEMKTFGIGPVLGLNLHLAETLSLAFKVGALGTWSWGEIDNRSTGDDWDIDSESDFTYASAGILFRLGE